MPKYKLAVFQVLLLFLALQLGCTTNIPHQKTQNENQQPSTNPAQSPDGRLIEDQIKNLVAKQLNIKPEIVDVNAPLSKQKVAADELDVVEIVMTLEETFDIEIKDEEIGDSVEEVTKTLTVKKLTDIVLKKKKP